MEVLRLLLGTLLCSLALATNPQNDNINVDMRPEMECRPHDSSANSCQNFARFCINMINDQIRKNLNASYTYQAMSRFFDRDDVAYRGFSKYFGHLADEQKSHADELMQYLLQRGGRLHLKKIHDPKLEWSNPTEAFDDALRLEHDVNAELLDVHWVASDKNDPHLIHFLEGKMLSAKVEVIHQLSQHVTWMKKLEATGGLGWHMYDEHLYHGIR